MPLFRQLEVPSEVRFAFPAAPVDLRAELGAGYAGGRAWWMINPASLEAAMRGGPRVDRTHLVPDGLAEARRALTGVLSELETLLGAKRETTVLGGFSQGAMLTDGRGAARRPRFRRPRLDERHSSSRWTNGSPLLLEARRHEGDASSRPNRDPVLPFAMAERLRDLLEGAGADLRWVEFAGGHTITGGVLQALGRLIGDVAAVP